MPDTMLKLKIFARAEMALAQIKTQRSIKKTVLIGTAGLFVLAGLGMLDYAGVSALIPVVGQAFAAAIVAAVNIIVAVVVLAVANKAGAMKNEEKLAQEIRDMAYGELNKDFEKARSEIEQITTDIRNIRSGFASLSSIVAKTVTPLIASVSKDRKKT